MQVVKVTQSEISFLAGLRLISVIVIDKNILAQKLNNDLAKFVALLRLGWGKVQVGGGGFIEVQYCVLHLFLLVEIDFCDKINTDKVKLVIAMKGSG